MARRDEGSASDSIIQLDIESEVNCSDETRNWLSSLRNENERRKSIPRSHKIQRVPQMFRAVERNKKCYEPLVVSIGPYHHGKPELQLMENQKRHMACEYANNNQHILERLYTNVMRVAKYARECYQDQDTLTNLKDDEFTRMMFLDGCFVLQFIVDFIMGGNYKIEMTTKTQEDVKRDLLLLENQIPFRVLKGLMHEVDLLDFFSYFIETFGGKSQRLIWNIEDHLEPENEPFHLLQYTQERLIRRRNDIPYPIGRRRSPYRSAKELKAKGIHFRPSFRHPFTEVNFRHGICCMDYLYLLPITVDDFTKSLLLNIVVYESCTGKSDGLSITSYVCFLDSLIDDAEDVKELRSARILNSCLGSDQQVADLFNQIAENLVPDPSAYADVKSEIEEHCRNRMKVRFADFWNTYFASPWTFLALVGAIFALILTVIQTYKAMYPPKPQF